VRVTRDERQRGKPARQDEHRQREQRAERRPLRQPAATEVAGERRQRRHDERLVVNLRSEAPLGEDRLVEEADAGCDQAVQRRPESEDPERWSGERRRPRVSGHFTGDRVAIRLHAKCLGTPAHEQPRRRGERGNERHADGKPGSAPSPTLHERTHERKRDHESDAHDDGVDRHRDADSPHEPLAYHREADDRQRALSETPRQRDPDSEADERRRTAHRADDDTQRERHNR
jgi:hypothetical protein